MFFKGLCYFNFLAFVHSISFYPSIIESKAICSVDRPRLVLENVTNCLQCALSCTTNPMFTCKAFYFVASKYTCHLLQEYPNSFYVVTYENCIHYQDSENLITGARENLAYNQPVFISTPYKSSPAPMYIVDGLISTDYWTSCCSTGDNGGGPNWFVVEFARDAHVYYVLVINRDILGNRMNYFTVGLSKSFNASTKIVRGQYKLCGVYLGTTKDGGTFIQVCQDLSYLSRYVILQQSLNNEGLFTVCEVKVFEF